ncbi:molybdate ABC transporter substrate-binding protein [soil metagenome]
MGRTGRRLLCVALLALSACSPATADPTASDNALNGEVTVFAAASLTDAFTEIGQTFEAAHPGATVTFNFAGSQQLSTQIVEGAPADVFASADQRQMDSVVDAGLTAGAPAAFAGNRLEIAVEPGNPTGIATLADLARDDVTVVLAADEVPAGRYAREALDAAGVTAAPVSLETDVRGVLTKVSLGEADAGIVYASDIAAVGDRVDGVEIPDEHNVTAAYPIAALRSAPRSAAGQAFVAMVRSEVGQETLGRHGFLQDLGQPSR